MRQAMIHHRSIPAQLVAMGRHAVVALGDKVERYRTYRRMMGLQDRLLEDAGWNRGDVEDWYNHAR